MEQIIIFIISLFIFASCDYPFFNTQDKEEPNIAVSSFFTADSILRVKVEPVFNAFSNQPKTLTIEKVKVINRTTKEEFLLQLESNNSSVYTTTNVIPRSGDVFTAEVYINGEDNPVIATDTIPDEKPYFRLVNTGLTTCAPYGFYNDISVKPSAVFRFIPNKMKSFSYYEFFVVIIEHGNNLWPQYPDTASEIYLESTSAQITAEDYYPSNPVIDEVGPLSLLFKSSGFADSATINFSYYTSLSGDYDSIYIPNHDLCIELREVSYNYYKYMTSLYSQKYAIDGNYIYGMPAPVSVYSNVENGTGIFAAYNSISQTYYVKSIGVYKQLP